VVRRPLGRLKESLEDSEASEKASGREILIALARFWSRFGAHFDEKSCYLWCCFSYAFLDAFFIDFS
jgi:hypothetical protein